MVILSTITIMSNGSRGQQHQLNHFPYWIDMVINTTLRSCIQGWRLYGWKRPRMILQSHPANKMTLQHHLPSHLFCSSGPITNVISPTPAIAINPNQCELASQGWDTCPSRPHQLDFFLIFIRIMFVFVIVQSNSTYCFHENNIFFGHSQSVGFAIVKSLIKFNW